MSDSDLTPRQSRRREFVVRDLPMFLTIALIVLFLSLFGMAAVEQLGR